MLINAIVWGDAYIDALVTYGFPSLLAAGNLSAVAREREIVFDFYTAEKDRARIDNHPVTAQVRRFAECRYNIVPDDLLANEAADASRWCAGAAQHCSAIRARSLGADLMFLCGSAIYSEDCLFRTYDFLANGYKAVVCAVPRTLEDSAYEALSRFARIEGGRITAAAAALSAFVVNSLHGHSIDSFIAGTSRKIAQNPVTLFFKTDAGFCCRTYEPSPLIISHELLTSEIEPDYFTIDVRFLPELLRRSSYDEVVKVIAGPEDGIVLTDVDCGDGPGMREYGDISLSLENCANGVLHTATRQTDLAYFRWALGQRFSFYGREGVDRLPDDGLEEFVAMDRLQRLIEDGRTAAEQRIDVYERLPDPAQE